MVDTGLKNARLMIDRFREAEEAYRLGISRCSKAKVERLKARHRDFKQRVTNKQTASSDRSPLTIPQGHVSPLHPISSSYLMRHRATPWEPSFIVIPYAILLANEMLPTLLSQHPNQRHLRLEMRQLRFPPQTLMIHIYT